MSSREGKLEFQIDSTGDGLVRVTFRRPGHLPLDVVSVIKRADESWNEEPCAPMGGPTCWLYGLIFGMKWRSITPLFALRSTVENEDLIRFFRGLDRRGKSKVLVMADDRRDGGSVFSLGGEDFEILRRELEQWRLGLDHSDARP